MLFQEAKEKLQAIYKPSKISYFMSHHRIKQFSIQLKITDSKDLSFVFTDYKLYGEYRVFITENRFHELWIEEFEFIKNTRNHVWSYTFGGGTRFSDSQTRIYIPYKKDISFINNFLKGFSLDLPDVKAITIGKSWGSSDITITTKNGIILKEMHDDATFEELRFDMNSFHQYIPHRSFETKISLRITIYSTY